MSDVKFNLKPVPKKKSRIFTRSVSSDEYSTISDYENDTRPFLSGYNYQPSLTSKLDNLKQKSFDQTLLNEIILWKVNRYATFSEDLIQRINALEKLRQGHHREGENVISELIKVHGVDLAMASTILRFRNPDVYQIIDRHAYRAVYGAKYPLYPASSSYRKIKLYFDYLDKLVQISKEEGLAFRTLDRLLYEFDKQLNGKL